MKTIGQMNRGVNKHTKKRTLREREKKELGTRTNLHRHIAHADL